MSVRLRFNLILVGTFLLGLMGSAAYYEREIGRSAREAVESEARLQLVRRVNRRAVYPDALNLGKLRLIPGGWVRGLGEKRAGAHQQQAGEQHRSRTDLRCTSHGVRSSGSGTSSTGLKFPSIKR